MTAALRVAQADDLALALFDALNAHDASAAMRLLAPDASIELVPARDAGARFVGELVSAFPDLLIQVRSLMVTGELAVAEIKLEGTQATDFLGILNQEKHLDVDQAWMVWTTHGVITRIRAYWCQNQLYRRLAVKRLDRISILG